MKTGETKVLRVRRGFTMSEVLISVFILGIGLIMLAAAFPVGADWTRQTSEESVATIVAQTAASAVQVRYQFSDLAGVGESLTPLPSLSTKLPWQARSYAHNTDVPWPVPWTFDVNKPATNVPPVYSWLALVRRAPGQVNGINNRFDLYILVCKRGELLQTFGTDSAAPGRVATDPKSALSRYYMPAMALTTQGSVPVGARGVGANSGVIFRKTGPATTSVPLMASESCWYVPAPDGADARSSPLVYVYATTLSF